MKSDSSRRPVAVEDLLRLKQAERPPAEFWSEFDRQLRAKQLAALVTRRPWWQTLPRLWSGLPRYSLTLGATAVVAVGFLSWRHEQAAPDRIPRPEIASVASEAPFSGPQTRNLADSSLLTEIEAPTPDSSGQEALIAVSHNARASGEESNGSPFSTGVFGPKVAASDTALGEPASAEGAGKLGGALAMNSPAPSRGILSESIPFEARPTRTRMPVEPLQQMTPPGEPRRSARFLTAMVSTVAGTETSLRSAERNSRIDEERLYDQVRRFGARGDRLELKF